MSDTVFRSKSEPVAVNENEVVAHDQALSDVTDVEVPYMDSQDFLTDYFNLGTEWRDHDSSFEAELSKIDNYIREKIEDGELANDQKAVTTLLKDIIKTTNLQKESRSVVKLEVIANYVEFLMKNDNLKSNLRRYGRQT